REERPCIFYLFHRPRLWNPVERVWMGYERKRGKLEQFNARLRGGAQTAFTELVGDASILGSIRYVITLDTDTQLPRDAARTLIGNLAHPLNRPVFDAARGRIVEGYAILQPRASISLTSAGQSRFTRLFAGESGIDPYTREVSDVYQDVFGEGSFIGKGIYDVDAFRQAVDGRFPEHLILSHDLLESGYARSALVSDVELIEEHPASYAIEASRRHRWIRGDWQIAGWLLPRVPGPPGADGAHTIRQPNCLSRLSQWKIIDNLRRSLVPASLLCLLAGGWLFGAGPAWFWTLLAVAVLCLPPLLSSAIALVRKPEERDWLLHVRLTGESGARPIVHAALNLILLPYDALICLDAILHSGVRMLFTQRGLLLWQLPSYARRNASRTPTDFLREMWIGPVVALALGVALAASGDDTRSAQWLLAIAPILLLWLVSPLAGWWISRPLAPSVPGLSMPQQAFLRASARRTWRYFADFVGPTDNWLPPDNFQEYPAPLVASRTSPTNMGMSLLADLAAHDFGYIPAGELLSRAGNTLATMQALERYRGHFYNWYDTRTLQPLNPQYVSSVDSGNLAGSLLTLQAGLVELKDQPALSPNAFQGLQDTLQVLAEHVPAAPAPDLAAKIRALQDTLLATAAAQPGTLPAALGVLDRIHDVGKALVAWLPTEIDIDGELYYWAQAFDRQCLALRQELEFLLRDAPPFDAIPTLAELAAGCAPGTPARPSALRHAGAAARIALIDELVERCRDLAAMDFEFLYDNACGLLSIGYDVGERRRDPSCYDLLASEARLASFLLIAQGQVPQKHWFALGRLLTGHGGALSLISWSGSMFEYLMPCLIMPSYDNTLLDLSCKAAVSRQIEYGRQRVVPWGISESSYNATDMHQVYQYRAFGVPGLGFKRGLGDDLVIAPYASALALTVMPREACRNLQTLADKGFLGAYGFYEAVDYTPTRVPPGKHHAIVRSFMAHHQGMSLLGFAHVLLGQPMQRRFMSDPLV
ncbi:MAG: cyclic beta 1-2 glucan synthetase, partial [Pseudomonadales bacterium]|nr:cyclic beta 1-2 glucan synthetase [Pseudomonadales bacterium]